MTIQVQVEKALFVAQEMELALMLAERCATDFRARSIARHVLVRAKDFIALTGALIKPMRDAGFAVEGLRSRRTVYMAAFDEYYSTSRTRLAAHVQDLEFLDRLELWTDIELSKLSYFVDGAREIYVYGVLTSGAAGCPPWSSLPDSGAPALIAILDALRAEASKAPAVARVGMDMLSATRPQTVSSLNVTPPHIRAAQLSAIDVWVDDELTLLSALQGHPSAVRVVKARLVTDVVSFADCLITRTSGDPTHRLTGLDDVLRGLSAARGDPSAIDELRRLARVDDRREELRVVRNHMGGHFDDDPTVTVVQLLQELDRVDLRDLALLYQRLRQAFHLTCERTFFLGMYRANGVVLQGVLSTSGGGDYVQPFGREPQSRPPEPRRLASNDHRREAMDVALELWLRAGHDAGVGKMHFWHLFTSSPEVERVAPEPPGGPGSMIPQPVVFREAHVYILERILSAATRVEAKRMLELVAECSRGYPEPLALLLHRALASPVRLVADRDVFDALGTLPIRNGEWARAPLIRGLTDPDPITAAVAATSLYRRLLEDSSVATVPRDASVFETHLDAMLERCTPLAGLVASMAVASLFTVPTVQASVVERETAAVLASVRHRACAVGALADVDPVLDALLRALDFVGLAVYVGEKLDATTRVDEAQTLFRAASDGTIRVSVMAQVRMQARLNLTSALIHIGDREAAVRVAASVVDLGALEPVAQLHAMRLLLMCDVAADQVGAALVQAEKFYVLPPEAGALADGLRRMISERSAPAT